MTTKTTPRLLDVGSARIAHHQRGSGPDVLFIHGWPLHGATWRHVVPRLEDRFTCHVIDLPGTGASQWTSATPLTIGAHAAGVERAIELLGLDHVALVAHDSGAAIARLVAASLGRRCTGLVLGNTEIPGYHPPMLELLLLATKLSGGGKALPLILKTPWLRRSPIGLGGCFSDPTFADGEFGRLFVEPLVNDPHVAAGQLGLLGQFDWSVLDAMASTHARITAPTAMIWGAEDPWFPLAKARPMAAQFPGGCELHEISPGKLFVHEERPNEWAAIAGRFLERHLSVARAA